MENEWNNLSYDKQLAAAERASATLMRNVYWWMTLALAITGLTAYVVATNETMVSYLFLYPLLWIGIMIADLALVIILSACINRLSFTWATVLFILYSLLNGVTFSSIFLTYEMGSIASTFFICAGMFAALAIVGSFTKKDLSNLGRILIMALFGLIIATIVNIFIQNDTFSWIVSIIGVLIFSGLTAYDAQKIKNMLNLYGNQDEEVGMKIALMGSLSLYLDFINLFLDLLRIFGRRR